MYHVVRTPLNKKQECRRIIFFEISEFFDYFQEILNSHSLIDLWQHVIYFVSLLLNWACCYLSTKLPSFWTSDCNPTAGKTSAGVAAKASLFYWELTLRRKSNPLHMMTKHYVTSRILAWFLFVAYHVRGTPSNRRHIAANDISLTSSSTANHICRRPAGEKGRERNQFHFRGTALGGWLVLEPWITPSLFYQFLGASEKWGDEAPSRVALDSYTFCTGIIDFIHSIAGKS